MTKNQFKPGGFLGRKATKKEGLSRYGKFKKTLSEEDSIELKRLEDLYEKKYNQFIKAYTTIRYDDESIKETKKLSIENILRMARENIK